MVCAILVLGSILSCARIGSEYIDKTAPLPSSIHVHDVGATQYVIQACLGAYAVETYVWLDQLSHCSDVAAMCPQFICGIYGHLVYTSSCNRKKKKKNQTEMTIFSCVWGKISGRRNYANFLPPSLTLIYFFLLSLNIFTGILSISSECTEFRGLTHPAITTRRVLCISRRERLLFL